MESLRAEKHQAGLAVTAYDGAIQECEHWLKTFLAEKDKPEEKDEELLDGPQAVPADRE